MTLIKQQLHLECKKCKSPFTIEVLPHQLRSNKYVKYCSQLCAHSREHTNETKNKIRKGVIRFLIKNHHGYQLELKKCLQCNKQVKARNRKHCSNACAGISRSQNYSNEQRVKARDRMLKRIACNPNTHPNRLCAKMKRSYPEQFLHSYLEDLGLRVNSDFYTQYSVGPYFVDFFFPTLNLVLEVDGERWHTNQEREATREKFIKQEHDILRFKAKPLIQKKYEKEIKDIVERLVGFQPTV